MIENNDIWSKCGLPINRKKTATVFKGQYDLKIDEKFTPPVTWNPVSAPGLVMRLRDKKRFAELFKRPSYIVYKKLDNIEFFKYQTYALNLYSLNAVFCLFLAVLYTRGLNKKDCENSPTDCTIKIVVNFKTITVHV